MIFLIISAAITIFLLTALVVVTLTSREAIEARLMAVTSRRHPEMLLEESERLGLGGLASALTSFLKPIRDLVTGNDGELSYRMALAGFRKPEHVEIFAAAKMLLPVLAVAAASFAGENWLAVALVGGAIGFFGPDLVITQMIARRREKIRHALPDALDLLVICMEAGLGIDQALVRVGDEIRTTSTDLADEFQVINREQRAGKPRLEAWRSMSDRLDIDYVRQFVSMLVQTERFGTPIANALGQFADTLRTQRMQAAEEKAARTGTHLLFPLVFCIFPSIFVVVLLPAILNIGKSINEFLK
jgi:tight adherence protein C